MKLNLPLKTLTPIVVASVAAFLSVATAPNSPPATNPAIVTNVATSQQLAAALVSASQNPNTTIRFTADINSFIPLQLRGRGTTLDLNNHAFLYSGSFTGAAGTTGCGLTVMPSLSNPRPIDGNKNAILCNPPGSVRAIEAALGGTDTGFVEPAPVQYADTQPFRDTYTLQRNILIPAQDITVKDGTFILNNPNADRPLQVMWARNVVCQNLIFDFSRSKIANTEAGAQESDSVSFLNCDMGTRYIAINSSYNTTIANCKNGGIAFEERCLVASVHDCNMAYIRVSDITCGGLDIGKNTFTNPDPNFGCIALTALSGDNNIHDNILNGAGTVWISAMGKGGTLKVKNNTGKNFLKYNNVNAGISEASDNKWSQR